MLGTWVRSTGLEGHRREPSLVIQRKFPDENLASYSPLSVKIPGHNWAILFIHSEPHELPLYTSSGSMNLGVKCHIQLKM